MLLAGWFSTFNGGIIKAPLPVQEDQPTGGRPIPSRKRKGGEKAVGETGPQELRACPAAAPRPGARALPPHCTASYWTVCSPAEGHTPSTQQWARVFRLHEARAGEGTKGCNRSFCSSFQLAVWAPKRASLGTGPGMGSPGHGEATSQPICPRPPRSQLSQSSRLERGKEAGVARVPVKN